MDLHEHYNQLTPTEKEFVDHAFQEVFAIARHSHVPLNGTDEAERAVDALARLVIESRAKDEYASVRLGLKT